MDAWKDMRKVSLVIRYVENWINTTNTNNETFCVVFIVIISVRI